MGDSPTRWPAEPLSPLAAHVDKALALYNYDIEAAIAAIDSAVPGYGGLFDPRTTDDERRAAVDEVIAAGPPSGQATADHGASDTVLYVDGSCHGNPGPAGAGAVLRSEKATLACLGWPVGSQAGNNIAEYAALKYGLDAIVTRCDPATVEVRCDSMTVIKSVWGAGSNAVAATEYRTAIENCLESLEAHEWTHLSDENYNPADAQATVGADIAALGP